MQLDLLWNFMQSDIEADKFETSMRQAPNRQKLLKHRAFLVDQQNNMKRIEGDIATMGDRLDAISDESDRLAGLLATQQAFFQENTPTDPEEAEKQIGQMQKLVDSLTHYEQELQKLRKDADTRDRQQKEIRVRAAKTKAEYDQIKGLYDLEFKKDSLELKRLRDCADALAQGIDAKLVERYRAIKQHVMPPMTMMEGDQCGGCHMSLPSVMLRDIRSGDKIVECDNCGRIIYVPEDAVI
ncbi:MAG: C4-type zinc ribbon domain-containing protein [Clostridia bacterium]